ncbi:hypothetical protein C8J57DRAFT_1375530 [Mycena rebaudengoi]|nr:hypothetical protein C8J57DRAFT_1375530 [Mycena rebaudengoi]
MLVTIQTEIEPPELRICPPLPPDGPLLLEFDPGSLSTSVQLVSDPATLCQSASFHVRVPCPSSISSMAPSTESASSSVSPLALRPSAAITSSAKHCDHSVALSTSRTGGVISFLFTFLCRMLGSIWMALPRRGIHFFGAPNFIWQHRILLTATGYWAGLNGMLSSHSSIVAIRWVPLASGPS